jgi:hypothetical protein
MELSKTVSRPYILKWLIENFAAVRNLFRVRLNREPIITAESLADFVHTRAAYIAQTSLFGYLKTRMGIKFRVLFEDETFSAEIHKASVKLFLSCLSDLTLYAVAMVARAGVLNDAELNALARHCHDRAHRAALAEVPPERRPENAEAAFANRLNAVRWADIPDGPEAFRGSEADLIRVAPVSDQFKDLDGEIVANSIRFRWHDVRDQMRKRLRGAEVAGDWRQMPDGKG